MLFVPAPHAAAIAFDDSVPMPEHPELVRSCVEAKELLGSCPEVRIPVLAGDAVRLSRLEFEAIIRPSVDALERVAAPCGSDVVLLVGAAAMGAFLEAEWLEPAPSEETPAGQRVPATPFI